MLHLPQNNELNAIRQTIQVYIDGLQNGDVDLLRTAFHPKAMMYSMTGNEEMAVEIEGLYAFAAGHDSPSKTGEPHNCVITHIHYTGNVANVEMMQEACFGSDYMNYFQLLKTGSKWTIVSKTYTGEQSKK